MRIMRKTAALLLAICVFVLSACSGSSVGAGKSKNAIVGKWESESNFAYFLENGELYVVSGDSSTGVYSFQVQETYSYSVNNDKISLIFEGEVDEAPFKITGDSLVINENAEWIRCEVEPVQSEITGTWQLAGIEGDFETFKYGVTVNEYIRTFYFYSDNTYKADWWFYHKGQEYFGEVTHGDYKTVNDGTTMCFDGRGYYDFELLGYGLMKLVDPSGNTLLYILQ